VSSLLVFSTRYTRPLSPCNAHAIRLVTFEVRGSRGKRSGKGNLSVTVGLDDVKFALEDNDFFK
jgi:hypothetical protein